MAPEELGSKVGIGPQELGRGGGKNRKLTVNYGLCMVSSMMNAFISGMVVMKFHMLVFPSICAIIDDADIYYFGNDLPRAYKRKKKAVEPENTTTGYRDLYVAKRPDSRSRRK